jgi:hypothetical protein
LNKWGEELVKMTGINGVWGGERWSRVERERGPNLGEVWGEYGWSLVAIYIPFNF